MPLTETAAELRRELGSYYTPPPVAQILANWAVRTKDDALLEPGFGGCGFLEASISALKKLGATSPAEQVSGCDKDENAFNFLAEKVGTAAGERQFLLADFMRLRPENFASGPFDVILGNPPYVSLHNMSQTQRSNAAAAIEVSGFRIDRRASLWAYFVIHALSFLKQGGRCAWVLPASFLQANYAHKVREYLAASFGRLVFVTLRERLFTESSAKERSVIVLCEDYISRQRRGRICTYFANDVGDLATIVGREQAFFPKRELVGPDPFALPQRSEIFERVKAVPEVTKFGSEVDIKIGIVTGANKFFVISDQERRANSIPMSAVKNIFSKPSQTKGLSLTSEDILDNLEHGFRCFLLDTEKSSLIEPVAKYLESFPDDKRISNKTFAKRKCWHQPDDSRVPQAFLTYMCDHGPRLIINCAAVNSTNTIHRCYTSKDPLFLKLISVSMQTSFSQISAEVSGRSYGSGVLKLEPSGAREIDILLPTLSERSAVEKAYNTVDSLLREGNNDAARRVADDFIYGEVGLSDAGAVSASLADVLKSMRHQRRLDRK